MPPSMPRRAFVIQFGTWTATTAAWGATTTGASPAGDPKSQPTPPATPPAWPLPTSTHARDYPAPKFIPKLTKPFLDVTLVRDFILFAHYDLEMTKKLLEAHPTLIHATVDWGAGDFESALGGASHLGKRDIVLYLLSQGARMDIFCAASLGLTDVVRGMISSVPALAQAKGPHGIPLLMHAKMGGAAAQSTYDYLLSLQPKTETKQPPDKAPEKKPALPGV